MGPAEQDWAPIDRRSTSAVVAGELRRRIVDGTLAPGTQLGEVAIAERLGVSRGPVREALQRLVQEGLAVAERHRGVFVVELDAADVADVYLARAAVERAAALVVVARRDQAVLDRLRALVGAMRAAASDGDDARRADLDLEFHETLVAASGSRRLVRMYGTLAAEARMCLGRPELLAAGHEQLLLEHEALVDALEAADVDDVLAVVDDHLRHAGA